MQAETKILICDDHPICHLGLEMSLKMILRGHHNFHKTYSGAELLASVVSYKPNVIILDLHLPDISGVKLVNEVQALAKNIPILIVTGSTDVFLLKKIRKLGVAAILSKTHDIKTLETAWKHLRSGSFYWDAHVAGLVQELTDEAPDLTPREWEVLALIANGKTNKDISDILHCSVETVKSHRANLGGKIQARNRAELIAWYLQRQGKSDSSSQV